MSEIQNEKPKRKRRRIGSGLVFAAVKAGILIFLIVICAALRQLGRLHGNECIWVKDLCGVITEVSLALLKGTPIDNIAIKAPEPNEDTATTAR